MLGFNVYVKVFDIKVLLLMSDSYRRVFIHCTCKKYLSEVVLKDRSLRFRCVFSKRERVLLSCVTVDYFHIIVDRGLYIVILTLLRKYGL